MYNNENKRWFTYIFTVVLVFRMCNQKWCCLYKIEIIRNSLHNFTGYYYNYHRNLIVDVIETTYRVDESTKRYWQYICTAVKRFSYLKISLEQLELLNCLVFRKKPLMWHLIWKAWYLKMTKVITWLLNIYQFGDYINCKTNI